MRPALLVVVVVACNGGSKHEAGPTPTVPGDAARSDAVAAVVDAEPMTWRGPNLYTLVDDAITIAVVLRPPGTWHEDWTDDHELLTSPAGSSMKVTIERGDVPPNYAELRPDVFQRSGGTNVASYLHRVTFPTGTWLARCELSLVDVDATLFAELARQCDQLEHQQEPDPRIAWTIDVKPAKTSLKQQGKVTVRYTATNRANQPVDAKAYNLEFWIDGESSMTLGMAFGNGGFDSIWTKLPPGETVDDTRSGMDDLVATPGDHVLAIMHLDREVARTTLHVTK